jgi:regulator of RNase E activity RraA
VFARDVGTTPPGPLFKVVAVNEPVTVSDEGQQIQVNPEDYLIGDVNGVVVLPRTHAERALPLMTKQVEADSKMAVEIQKGMTFTEASKRFRF